ncbi:MAG: hydantoinase B/oxoprolinase family protein [Deltaproteobacteria bacterium]|nr:hydantoinase B/oxoprolinase family protein [Deltaproteobacteria bacterium]
MSLALELTVFHKLFTAVAEEMGIVLGRSAFSPNIKERRDYSCAVCTAGGELLAQAAHIPVHLGALPHTLAAVLARHPLGPGDVLLLNDPYCGGTHLPDLTVIAPFFAGGNLLFYLVNRAHHADVGGSAPGSMPLARDLRDEGVVIGPTYLFRDGLENTAFLEDFLARVRVPGERQGDLAAQLAALRRGGERLKELVHRYGAGKLADMAAAVLYYAEAAMREVLREIPDGVYRFQDCLDDDGWGHRDLPVRLALTVAGTAAALDFRETADQAEGGINAVPAVVEAACYYVFLALLGDDYPINQGCFRPLTVLTRPGSLLQPCYPAPVAAGNVETSQRLVDVILGALARALPQRIPAASQGTMNNLAFGGRDPRRGSDFTYYETVAGGAGGGPAGPGADGVHTHMTNTRNTPVEVLEHDFPVLVERYALREASGGAGRHRGGRGLVRDFHFLTDVSVSLLTERRRHGPYGLAGGGSGAPGENLLILPDGRGNTLPGKINLTLPAGSRLSVRTPGGGGWGAAAPEPEASSLCGHLGTGALRQQRE